ncbi:MAG: hypothetical protein JXR77_02590, partial [Lentisphaeria bacterium]|nr:hypothetical protein [Lentisphaeria bacterium]
IVIRCLPEGLMAYLPTVGLLGFLPVSRMIGGPYRLDRHSGRLSASSGGKSYTSGDVIAVQIRRADTVRGELRLDPVQPRV